MELIRRIGKSRQMKLANFAADPQLDALAKFRGHRKEADRPSFCITTETMTESEMMQDQR